MANRKKCPLCNKVNDHVKKGTNAAGDQRLSCKGCKKSYVDTPAGRKLAKANAAKTPKKSTPKKTTPKKTTPKKTTQKKAAKPKTKPKKAAAAGKIKQTIIRVNGNNLSPKSGDLSVDDAFEMAKESFLELKKESSTTDIKGDTKFINFKIKLGRKG